jgi:hypothetical protein
LNRRSQGCCLVDGLLTGVSGESSCVDSWGKSFLIGWHFRELAKMQREEDLMILEIVDTIGREAAPDAVILFGSHERA